MKFSTLIRHSAELYRIIQKSPNPADDLTSQYLRSKKYIGSSERKVISEIVFCSLRISSLSQKAIDEILYDYKLQVVEDKLDTLIMITSIVIMLKFPNTPLTNLEKNLSKFTSTENGIDACIIEAAKELELFIESPELKEDTLINIIGYIQEFTAKFLVNKDSDTLLSPNHLCMQKWLIDALLTKYSEKQLNQLAFKLMYPASVCLRVNSLSTNRSKVLELLKNENIEAYESRFSPDGIILNGRPQLSNFDFYKEGVVEVQDIGSQLISYSLAVHPNAKILDACAGAGGKTLHLAVISEDRAKLVATDIEYSRLKELRTRADKAGISSVEIIPQKEMNLKKKIRIKFDNILIDAPCSGMGTVRRMPMPKWRLTEKLVEKLNKIQYSILEYYSDMLDVGGSLVYATCSLLPAENEMLINRFLAEHPDFEAEPIKPALDNAGVKFDGITDEDYMLYLSPLNGETDGFFLSKIKRIEAC